jgi:hypothetical protein
MSLLLLGTLLSPAAHAFCGTYVGSAGAELYNDVSQVAIVRQGNETVLSVANNVDGNFSDFALVIPVPEVLAEDDIHVLEHDLFARLDAYSAPRRVEYTCDDFRYEDEEDWDAGGSSGGDGGSGGGGVEVEAEYTVGEYQIVILSATQSTGLYDWLNANGYSVPAQSVTILDEYISGGAYFLAAKVAATEGIEPGAMLSPLQFRYDSAVFGLPIRIGTTASKGVQDLIVYAINAYSLGRVGISNYAEEEIEEACMWGDGTAEEFAAYYTAQFDAAYADADAGMFVTEYAWGGSQCDPCNGTPPDATDLVTLGMAIDAETWHYDPNVFFTRLHMRYTPAQAHSDLVFYHSNITEQRQQRYIDYLYELEDRFPLCGEGMADDPGSCDGESGDDGGSGGVGGDDAGGSGGGSSGGVSGTDDDPAGNSDAPESKGCAVAPVGSVGGALLALVAVARRRRRD